MKKNGVVIYTAIEFDIGIGLIELKGLLGPSGGLRSTEFHSSLIQLTVFDLKTTDCVKVYPFATSHKW